MTELELVERKLNDVRMDGAYERVNQLDQNYQQLILDNLQNVWNDNPILQMHSSVNSNVGTTSINYGLNTVYNDLNKEASNVRTVTFDDVSKKKEFALSSNNLTMNVMSDRSVKFSNSDIKVQFLNPENGLMRFFGEYQIGLRHKINFNTSVTNDGLVQPIYVTLQEFNEETKNFVNTQSMTVESFEELRGLRFNTIVQMARNSIEDNKAKNPAVYALAAESLDSCLDEYLQNKNQNSQHM